MKLLIVLVVGVVVVLLAQFLMETWADQSDLAHWIQHGLLFWGGVTLGVAAYGLWRRGHHRV